MASREMEVALALVLVAMLWAGATAQSSCTSALTSLAPCLNYITGNPPSPSSSCCSNLASVVKSSPKCLCSVVNGGASNLGISINQTRALQLPTACNVKTPPASQCNAASPATPSGSPVGSPSASPADQTPEGADTPSASEVPPVNAGSASGSKTVPSTGAGSNDGNTAKAPVHLVLSLLFVAIFGSTGAKI